jgi:hypothetical protein
VYVYDGQDRNPKAFFEVSGNNPADHLYRGFGCDKWQCVREHINDCMSGKDCEP